MVGLNAIKQLVPEHAKPLIRDGFQKVTRVTARWRCLPDFIIVGAQKAGTTSLYHYLQRHKQIRMSWVKEVHYFDNNFDKGDLWYRSHFPIATRATNGSVVGEASPYYLAHPHAPARIRSLLPSARLIVLLRNPRDRAISHYYHQKRAGIETLPMMQAFRNEEERINSEWQRMLEHEGYTSAIHQRFSYKQRGIYIEQLQRYLQYFDIEQVLTLNSDLLFTDPRSALQRITEHLRIDQDFKDVALHPKNVGGYDNKIEKEIREYLDDYFRPHNQRLFEFLGESFDW